MPLDTEEFASRLDSARRRKGWSQKRLAEEIGVTPNAITFWKQGRRSPRPENLAAIAEALGVTTSYLLGEEEGVGQQEHMKAPAHPPGSFYTLVTWLTKRSGQGIDALAESAGVDGEALLHWLAYPEEASPDVQWRLLELAGLPRDALMGESEDVWFRSLVTREIEPGFPKVPDFDPVEDAITAQHIRAYHRMQTLRRQADRYSRKLRGEIDALRGEIAAAVQAGVPVEVPVRIKVETELSSRSWPAWQAAAKELATSVLECPSCHTEVPVIEDPEGWEEQLVAEGRKEQTDIAFEPTEEG